MNMVVFRQTTASLATRIAAAILLKDKAISVSEIRALPFVESDEEAMLIAKQLRQMYRIEVERMKSSSLVSRWVDVLKLKTESPEHV